MSEIPRQIRVGERCFAMLSRCRERLSDSPSSLDAILRAEKLVELTCYAHADAHADWDERDQQLIEIGREVPFEALVQIIDALQTWDRWARARAN